MSIIVSNGQLDKLCDEIDNCGRFAMDLEFIPERSYRPKLCLVQVATDEDQYIIDPLEMEDLNRLWSRVANEDIPVVLHAADQDLSLIYNYSGMIPQNIMDTQIAAGFAGFGYPIGYGNLLNKLLGISISKTESFTDWTRRPLTESQTEYALNDVRHILPMFDRLAEKLEESNRLTWVEEECKRYSKEDLYESDRSKLYLKVKGASSLHRRNLAVLQSLLEWRDELAEKLNRPPRSVIPDNILLELSRRPPEEVREIQRIRGIRPDHIKQHGDKIISAIKEGLKVRDDECPTWPKSRAPARRDAIVVDVLFNVVKITCNSLGLAPELVATRSALEKLVRAHREKSLDKSKHPLLNGWQFELVGNKVMALLDGAELVMKVTSKDPPVSLQIRKEES